MSARGICKGCGLDRSIWARGHCKACRQRMLLDGSWDNVPKLRTLRDQSKVSTCTECGTIAYMYRKGLCWRCYKPTIKRRPPKGDRHFQRLGGADDVTLFAKPKRLECRMGLVWECYGAGIYEDELCFLAKVGSERMWMPQAGMVQP